MALIDKASLLMVPSTYEAGKLYNVLPSGNRAPDQTGENSGYDQTRADFDFDRGSNAAATRVNADGLIEKYRENLYTQSNNFSHSDWNVKAGTFTQGVEDPDGGNNAWAWAATNTDPYLYQSGKSLTGVSTLSIWVKGVGSTIGKYFEFRIGASPYYNFVLTGEWQRFEYFVNHSSGGSSVGWEYGNPAVAGDVVHIYQAQYEVGTIATDYLDSTSVTGKAGVLIDLPRIDYSSGAGALLLEPQRANLATHSEYFGAWTKAPSSITITDNAAISPEGVENAAYVQFTGASQYIRIAASGTSATYTGSVYIKGTAGETIQLAVAGVDSGLKTLTGGWDRIESTQTGASTHILIHTFGGATARNMYVYGAQLEAGSYVSSYIPNHGESGGVTRAADSMTLSNLQTNNLLGSNQGSFVFHYKPYNAYTGSTGKIFDFRIDANNRVATYFSSGTLRLFSNIAGATNFNQATTLDGDTEFKIALAFDTNSTLVYINGSLEYTLNGFALGLTDFDILPPTNGVKLSECSWYPTKLSGAELETLTTL